MDKNFVLLIQYECGECAYLTNTPDLSEALEEYVGKLKSTWEQSMSKSMGLPSIKQAKIVKLWK